VIAQNLGDILKKLIYIGVSVFYSTCVMAHGLVEKPASRAQFCGVESKPHEIYGNLTHEQCRPIFTKPDGTMDNSIYNFMAILTHTTGRQGRTSDNLPKNVCGFDSENWGRGKTPWDSANDWPVNKISSGTNQFVWNISWGNHFGDTDEFAYWITKPEFIFSKDRELSWSDFEDKPFCLLKYDDKNSNANPNIVADKLNNKFATTCQVPVRQKRAVIYAEWGRNFYTFERFHSCIDVVFDGGTTPSTVDAVISSLPNTITGATELILDGSQSLGQNLTYQWSVTANDPSLYTLFDMDKAKARLVIKDTEAEQRVAINLTVKQGETSDNTSVSFMHLPKPKDVWKNIGSLLENNTLVAGDKVSLRVIDDKGSDHYLPESPVLLDAESALPANWGYTLAQAINNKNSFSVKIGVLNSASGAIEPIRSATENKIYAPSQSVVSNAYVMVERKQDPTSTCLVQKKAGGSAWWMGYDVYSDKGPITLDFTATGIDLTNVIVDAGVFGDVKVVERYRLVINQKPTWVTKTNPGYIGFRASNYEPLNTALVAACHAG
jgi:chitin-binding protein